MSTISTGCTAARPGHEIGTFWHADQGQLRLRILKAVHPAYAPAALRITLPLALPGIAAGAVLAFARALGEFGATVVIAGNIEGRTRTMAVAVYTLIDSPAGMADARLLALISVGISVGALIAYEALARWQASRLEVYAGD